MTHGPHRLVRNPMYVGWSRSTSVSALTLRSPLMLAGWPVSAALIHRVVLHEGQNGTLEAAFGADYVVYRAATGRDFPRLTCAPEPTSSSSGLTPARTKEPDNLNSPVLPSRRPTWTGDDREEPQCPRGNDHRVAGPAGRHAPCSEQRCSKAKAAAAVREDTSILPKMLDRCRATVFSLR